MDFYVARIAVQPTFLKVGHWDISKSRVCTACIPRPSTESPAKRILNPLSPTCFAGAPCKAHVRRHSLQFEPERQVFHGLGYVLVYIISV